MNKVSFSQRGISLLELLIALTIAIVIIVAMLRVFVVSGKVTAESTLGANTDSKAMLSLIAVDQVIQGIGFYDPSDYGVGFKAYVKATAGGSDSYTVTSNSTANAEYLVWSVGQNKCQAIQNHSSGLLIYGKGNGYSCSSLSKPNINLDTPDRLLQIDEAVANIQPGLDSNDAADKLKKVGSVQISIKKKECWPFGIKSDVILPGQYMVEVRINTYAASSAQDSQKIQNDTCLFNIK